MSIVSLLRKDTDGAGRRRILRPIMRAPTGAPITASPHLALGRQPVWLVEIPGASQYLATREITLEGRSYLPILAPGGIADITRELLTGDVPRVSNATIQIVNATLYSGLINSYQLDNQPMRILAGFLGYPYEQYRVLFTGPLDNWQAQRRRFQLEALDGTFQRHVTLPAIDGATFGTLTNPADVIQYLAQTYVPLLTLNVDSVARFKAARTAWTFQGSVDEGTNSFDLFVRMAHQAQGRYIESPNGEGQLIPLESSTPPLQTFTASEIAPDSVTLGRSAESEVYTDIYVWYGRDPTLGTASSVTAYAGAVVATPDGTTHPTDPLHVLCQLASTALNGISHRLDYLADWIGSATEAHRLLKFLVIWHTQRRHVVHFSTWSQAWQRDVTDAITVMHDLVPAQVQTFEIVATTNRGPHSEVVTQELDHPYWHAWVEHWGTVTSGANPLPPGVDPAPIAGDPWDPTIQETLIISEDWEPGILELLILRETWET